MDMRKYSEIRMYVVGAEMLERLKNDFRGHAMSAERAGRKTVYDVTLKVRKRSPAKEGVRR